MKSAFHLYSSLNNHVGIPGVIAWNLAVRLLGNCPQRFIAVSLERTVPVIAKQWISAGAGA